MSIAERDNNPGDERPSHGTWQHRTGVDGHDFAIFANAHDGWAALAYLICIYWYNLGKTTPALFLNLYAPSSDRNDPHDYAESVARYLHMDREHYTGIYDTFDMSKQGCLNLAHAIAAHESNTTWNATTAAIGVEDGWEQYHRNNPLQGDRA